MSNVTRLWQPDPRYTPEQALQVALQRQADCPLERVIIIGEDADDGELYLIGSDCTRAQANWLLDRAKHQAIGVQYEMDDGIDYE